MPWSCNTWFYDGHVLDFDTREPIEGAQVVIYSHVPHLVTSYFGGTSYCDTTITDSKGNFRFLRVRGNLGYVRAEAPGYHEFHGDAARAKAGTLWVNPREPGTQYLKRLNVRIGEYFDGGFFGYSFALGDTSSDPTLCDLFPVEADRIPPPWDTTGVAQRVVLASMRHKLELAALGDGGVIFIPHPVIPESYWPLDYMDEAPLGGYSKSITIDVTGPGGVAWVRTRDGEHYAKLRVLPRASVQLLHRSGTDRDTGQRNVAWSYRFESRFAREGGRDLRSR
jgi:hypothetical protein